MEETKKEQIDAKSDQSSEDNFSWEEWTVIDSHGDNAKKDATLVSPKVDDTTDSGTSFSDIENTSDVQEARECIEILSPNDLMECPDAKNDDNHCSEESDGVSVITESDAEELVGKANENQIVPHEIESNDATKRYRDIEINNLRMIILVICCLLGSAILCVAINRGIRRNSSDFDTALMMKCNNLFESIKRSADANTAREINSDMPMPVFRGKKLENRTKNKAEQLEFVTEYLKTIESMTNVPDNELFERLQIFLRTMCLFEGILNPESNSDARQPVCEKQPFLPELMNLRVLLKSVVSEMDALERPAHERFLTKLDSQIKSMSDSLITDLTRALDKLTTKNTKKLDKIGFKLTEKLCILRNTLPSESKHRELLEMNNNFIDNCDKFATRKSDKRIKKYKSESPASPKREKRNSKEREADRMKDLSKKPRKYELKRQNNTKSIESLLDEDNLWDTRKCYIKRSSSIPYDQESEGTCATLLAPPKSHWNSEQKTFDTRKHEKDIEGEKRAEKHSNKSELKDDREAPKVLKTKYTKQDLHKKNNHKPIMPSVNVEDYTIKKVRGKMDERSRSPYVLSEPDNSNYDTKYKRHSSSLTDGRGKKRFEEEYNDFILLNRNEEEEMMHNGRWQFDRSRIRDQLRKDESTSNWYFERVGSRKSSRMHCNDENEDPRCGSSH